MLTGEEGAEDAPDIAAAVATRPHRTHPGCIGGAACCPEEYEFWRDVWWESNGECEDVDRCPTVNLAGCRLGVAWLLLAWDATAADMAGGSLFCVDVDEGEEAGRGERRAGATCWHGAQPVERSDGRA